MNLTRTIQVSGTTEVSEIPVSINFSYTDTNAPTYCSFSFTYDNVNVYGNVGIDGMFSYTVSNGTIDKTLIESVRDECINLITNYGNVTNN